MSHFLSAHGGALQLARRLVPAWAGRRNTLTPRLTSRPPQGHQVRYRISWKEWLRQHPTTVQEAQAVYDACTAARIFEGVASRPITGSGPANIRVKASEEPMARAFFRTPGLSQADWADRGLDVKHAVHIAVRLKAMCVFRDKKMAKQVFATWDEWAQQPAELGPVMAEKKEITKEKAQAMAVKAERRLPQNKQQWWLQKKQMEKQKKLEAKEQRRLEAKEAKEQRRLEAKEPQSQQEWLERLLQKEKQPLQKEKKPLQKEKKPLQKEKQPQPKMWYEKMGEERDKIQQGQRWQFEQDQLLLQNLIWKQGDQPAWADVAIGMPWTTTSAMPVQGRDLLARRRARALRRAEEASDWKEGIRSKRRPILKKDRGGPGGAAATGGARDPKPRSLGNQGFFF